MPNSILNAKNKAIFFTILAGVLWGTSFPIIKIGLETIDPFAFVFWRFLVSVVVLVVLMLILRKLDFKIVNRKLLIFLGIANGEATYFNTLGCLSLQRPRQRYSSI